MQNKNRRWLSYGLIAWSCVFSKSATAQEFDSTGLITGTSFERRVVQDRSKRNIAYYVSRPKSGTAPIMLVIQGSGCTPVLTIRDGQASSSIYNLEKFARDGKFTVIAVEKPFSGLVVQPGSAEGYSDAFNEDFTAESWRDALQAALNDARKANWVDHTRTLLLGSSEGAVMASVVAANDPTITDVISISGSGTTQLFDFIAQAYGDCFNASVCLDDIEKNVAAIKADPHSHTKFAWGHPYKRWSSFFNIDPGELLLKSKARVYVAIGTADEAVPAISQELAATKLLLAGRDITVRRVADGTHSLNRKNAGNWDELDRELRKALLRSKWSSEVFELTVLGKRNAYRVVPVSSRTVNALRRHWDDRGLDFDATGAEGALLAPVVVPGHAAASTRHREGDAQFGYTTDGLYKLFQSAIKRLRLDHTVDKSFSLDDLAALSRASPHALRHTFGTLAVADGMPIDVAQAVLGHKDSATTAIYVQAKTKRVVEEGAKYFAKKHPKKA